MKKLLFLLLLAIIVIAVKSNDAALQRGITCLTRLNKLDHFITRMRQFKTINQVNENEKEIVLLNWCSNYCFYEDCKEVFKKYY